MKYRDLREKIRSMRSQGLTYSEIQHKIELKIPKSTLSYLCRGVALPADFERKITKLNLKNIKRGRLIALAVNREKRHEHLQTIEKRSDQIVRRPSFEMLKVALALLYLGEGAKWRGHSGLALGSSNPVVIRLYIKLLRKCYGIHTEKLRCRIQFRADQNLHELELHWSRITGIPRSHFYRTKPDPRTIGRPTQNTRYRGVCVISCAGTAIQLELEAIANALLKRLGP